MQLAVHLLVVLGALVDTAVSAIRTLPEREVLVALLQCVLDVARADLERERIYLSKTVKPSSVCALVMVIVESSDQRRTGRLRFSGLL